MYQQVILLFALILTGYLCKKGKIVNDGMTRGMNKFIITLAYPCLILSRTTQLTIAADAFLNFLLTVLFSVALFLLFGGYAFLYGKVRKFPYETAPIAEFSILAPNNGFLGFPVAVTFFGDIGLLYMVACNLGLNIVFFSYGITLVTRGREKASVSFVRRFWELLKLIFNPKIFATIIGMILNYNQLQLPGVLSLYVSTIGSIATPMAMILIGAMLSDSRISNVIRSKLLIETSVSKLIIVPLITLGIVYFLPIDTTVKMILIVGNALPVATTVPILSEQYDRDKVFASETLFLSTICAIITVPLVILLVKMMF
jgi:predicted permease